ncbi:uncharacterized protein C2845_PM06G31870 [Panicum miliaceum]|uniref:DUF7642 domain-containing protein n=1 Tax=Panicum miliaceum TaxID=4540 RepID=A0A3L6R4K6_PANMI|nr:uncharacterized protein C2845_PM06G31870 [Panicum miliaceum]
MPPPARVDMASPRRTSGRVPPAPARLYVLACVPCRGQKGRRQISAELAAAQGWCARVRREAARTDGRREPDPPGAAAPRDLFVHSASSSSRASRRLCHSPKQREREREARRCHHSHQPHDRTEKGQQETEGTVIEPARFLPSARTEPQAARRSMGLPDERVQVDALERHLFAGLSSNDYNRSIEDEVLHVLAWGVGVLMLLYLPIRIYVCRRDFRSRKLYLTPHAVVYKVNKPVAFPCFGVFKKEKYVILPSISDVVVEQGYLQSFFGVYSLRIENVGVRKPPSDDVKITGVAHPHDFRKAVLVHLLNTRNLNFSRRAPSDGQQSTSLNPLASAWEPPLGDLILEKLDEVEISVKAQVKTAAFLAPVAAASPSMVAGAAMDHA